MIWLPFFFSQYQCSGICCLRLPLVCVALTFKCHFRCVEAAWCYWMNLMRCLSSPESKTVVGRDTSVFLCFLPWTDSAKEKNKKWYVWWFLLAASWRRGDDKNRPKPCNTLTMLSQELFPSDLSMGELSDTSSALLTRRYRSLIEVGLSLPSSPMILFSMGQWEVGGSPGGPGIGRIAICLLLLHREDVKIEVILCLA